MTAYIKGAAVISGQPTFTETGFPASITDYAGVDRLKCIEPAYRDFIDPMVARRMSRIVKMGVCSALKCLQDTGIKIPDAIITGTGLGCLEDTEKFLSSVYSSDEKLLNPTPFIQSTHNTVAGAVALAIKCNNYNATYTHRGFSFESALNDALLLLSQNPLQHILVGGFDELTEGSYAITKRLGLWKNHPVDASSLLRYNTRGSLPGEGAAFFMLSGQQGNNDWARIKSLETFYKPYERSITGIQINEFLHAAGVNQAEIDLVILGLNGDTAYDQAYYQLMKNTFSHKACGYYKHLCGEYDTSSSFGLWLASVILKEQSVPACVRLGNKTPDGIRYILLYNHLRGKNHALYLLERC